MTINLSDNSPRISYTVAESVTQTSFTVPFEFFADADLNVYVDGTLKTLTTDYTTTGGDGSTGSITMSVTGASGGSTVVITRDIAIERTTDFPTSGPFNISSLNTELDRLTAVAADLEDLAGRGVKLADFDTQASLTLPLVSDRPNRVLGFNSAGDTLVTQELGTNKGNWATSTAYQERDIVRDSSTGSIYIVNSAHTSTGTTPLDTNVNSAKYDVIFDVDDIISGSATFTGNLNVNGDTTLGDSTNDIVTINSLTKFGNDIRPTTGDVFDIGRSTDRFADIWINGTLYANDTNSGVTAYNITVSNALTVNGDTTLGNSLSDEITFTASVSSNIIPSSDNARTLGDQTKRWSNVHAKYMHAQTLYLEGATIDGFETALIPVDPTADRVITFPDDTGTVALLGTAQTFTAEQHFTDRIDIDNDEFIGWGGGTQRPAIRGDKTIDELEFWTGGSERANITNSGLSVNGNITATGNATITGDLTVNGTTTTISTTNTVISDALMELGNGTTGTPANDAGIVIERGDSDNAFIGWDESTDKFIVGTGTFTGASTGDLTITSGTLVADIEGNVTGDLTGNVTGDVTGDVTGNVTGNVTGDVTGNLTGDVTGDVTGNVAGDLTGDLVANTTNAHTIVPHLSGRDLGANTNRWENIYVRELHAEHIKESVHAMTTTQIAPFDGSIQTITLSSNTTFSYSTYFYEGHSVTLMIDDGSAYTAAWPATTWVNNNGAPPTLKTSGYSVVTIWRVGSTYYGAVVGAA